MMKRIIKSVLASKKRKATMQVVLKQAITEGLFDKTWYEHTYNLSFSSEQEAFEDYIRKSRFSPVNPSNKFDNESYHRRYLDVYHAQVSPLYHYLNKGRGESRYHSKAHLKWTPSSTETLSNKLTAQAASLNVAVCLHIFYADFVERFASALDSFPLKVDLFISVVDKKSERRARKILSKHPKVKGFKSKLVQNRGRNFGPLLVEYAKDLRCYDFFLHLHSKKSLYSGKEQTQWADYLVEYLLRDSSVLTRMLNAVASDEKLGVYYPTTFWLMPTWVNHLTMNKGFVKDWQDKLGIGQISDFLAYPAGGMFGARPKALKQLLEEQYSYDDFPKEPLPNDGSYLHALERVIGALAEQNGYHQLFYYPSSGEFTKDQSYITANYKSAPIWDQMEAIRSHQCISFDVFDTLVRREYTVPDYAKLKLGKLLAAEGLVSSALEFVKLRNQAEFELRKKRDFIGDVGIEDIYLELATVLSISEEKATVYMNREFEFDFQMILPKNEMIVFFNELNNLGHILWIISDTYYTKKQVALMLRKVGVTGEYRLIVSSEEQKRKDNGSMWVMIKSELEAESISNYLHIGDNVVADAQRPGDLGLATFHILHPLDKWEALGFPEVLSDDNSLNEVEILKWGSLVSNVGRNPFIGS